MRVSRSTSSEQKIFVIGFLSRLMARSLKRTLWLVRMMILKLICRRRWWCRLILRMIVRCRMWRLQGIGLVGCLMLGRKSVVEGTRGELWGGGRAKGGDG